MPIVLCAILAFSDDASIPFALIDAIHRMFLINLRFQFAHAKDRSLSSVHNWRGTSVINVYVSVILHTVSCS